MQLPTSVQLVVNFIKEDKQVIAYAPALDLSTVGKDEEQARSRFHDIVTMFLKDITERNVINEVLTDLGWKKEIIRNKPQWVPPVVTSMNLQVPMSA